MYFCSTEIFAAALQVIIMTGNGVSIDHVDNYKPSTNFQLFCTKIPTNILFTPYTIYYYIGDKMNSNNLDLRAIAKELKDDGMACNCDLDNWQPEISTGHSCVCRIHKRAIAIKHRPEDVKS